MISLDDDIYFDEKIKIPLLRYKIQIIISVEIYKIYIIYFLKPEGVVVVLWQCLLISTMISTALNNKNGESQKDESSKYRANHDPCDLTF